LLLLSKDAEAVCEIVQFGFTTQVSATFTPVSCVEICEPITENVGSECAHCTATAVSGPRTCYNRTETEPGLCCDVINDVTLEGLPPSICGYNLNVSGNLFPIPCDFIGSSGSDDDDDPSAASVVSHSPLAAFVAAASILLTRK